jgi:hypothetical protein
MVWDRAGDVPAEVYGFPRQELRKHVAALLCQFLNAAARLDALAPTAMPDPVSVGV